jgi:hypothetical protein
MPFMSLEPQPPVGRAEPCLGQAVKAVWSVGAGGRTVPTKPCGARQPTLRGGPLDECELWSTRVQPARSLCPLHGGQPRANGRGIGVEPLWTLSKYLRFGKVVLFGQHLHPLDVGSLQTGQRGTVTQ